MAGKFCVFERRLRFYHLIINLIATRACIFTKQKNKVINKIIAFLYKSQMMVETLKLTFNHPVFDVSHYLFYLTHSALNGSNREIKLGVISINFKIHIVF